jgi:hypothetical protein
VDSNQKALRKASRADGGEGAKPQPRLDDINHSFRFIGFVFLSGSFRREFLEFFGLLLEHNSKLTTESQFEALPSSKCWRNSRLFLFSPIQLVSFAFLRADPADSKRFLFISRLNLPETEQIELQRQREQLEIGSERILLRHFRRQRAASVGCVMAQRAPLSRACEQIHVAAFDREPN